MSKARSINPGKRKETPRDAREERFQLVANTAPVMIWITDVDKLCTYVNQRWLDFTGRLLEDELGNGWSESVHPDDLAHCLDEYTRAFDQRKPFQIEYRLRRHDGRYRWLLDSGAPRFDAEGSFIGYIGSVIDVTQHKLAEAALSKVSQRLIDAQEEERAWIARELHDDMGQRLSLLMMSLEGMRNRASLNGIRDEVKKAIRQTTDLAKGIRALSHRLHSPNLDYVGLVAAASACCSELARQHKVKISLRSQDIPRDLSREVSLCLFRILQEALQNAIKHSGSRHLNVSFKGGINDIELAVHDKGTGFKTEQALKGRGLGLSSMKERMKLVKGRLSIDTELGRGTTIHAWVPLRRRRPQNGTNAETGFSGSGRL